MDGSAGDGLVDSAQIRTFDLNARNYKKSGYVGGVSYSIGQKSCVRIS